MFESDSVRAYDSKATLAFLVGKDSQTQIARVSTRPPNTQHTALPRNFSRFPAMSGHRHTPDQRLFRPHFWLVVLFTFLLIVTDTHRVHTFSAYAQNPQAPTDSTAVATNRTHGRESMGAVRLGIPTSTINGSAAVRRTILGLYNSQNSPLIRDTIIHRAAEMPLNHLGLTVEYHDLKTGLPDLTRRDDIRGVLAWLSNEDIEDAAAYYNWASEQLESGIRYVVMGDVISDGSNSKPAANRFFQALGVRLLGEYVSPTYDVKIVDLDPDIAAFERGFSGTLPAFDRFEARDNAVRTHLTLRQAGHTQTDSHLVLSGPNGGLVAPGYATAADRGTEYLRWRINPISFFRLAFATSSVPKPDVTTLSGRRIFYSHIDGDGWLSLSTVDRYSDQGVIAAEVIRLHAIVPYPDLPVTVAPIAADLDPRWVGTEESRRIAQDLFLLPQVEAGSHTYSHPFDWKWFEDYHPAAERIYLHKYFPSTTRNSVFDSLVSRKGVTYDDVFPRYAVDTQEQDSLRPLEHTYETPRAYGHFPFDLENEVSGAADFIEALLPPNKRVEILQLTGNTNPNETALRVIRQAGLHNINGGDSRFDSRFPSYTSLQPIGHSVGNERQIYASNSNENTYTKLWTDRFFGFQMLRQTLDNTEKPIRLKPFNIYYHMYSGEKQSALNALLTNLDYAQSSELAPVTTSTYAAIAEGFYTTRFINLGDMSWQIENRNELQTIRFDLADNLTVDFTKSVGVIGQRHTQGSLYIALDSAVELPVVTLRKRPDATVKNHPIHLIHGRWSITQLHRNEDNLSFLTQGFGPGEMVWHAKPDTAYEISAKTAGREVFRQIHTADLDGVLKFTIDTSGIDPLSVQIARLPPQGT